MNHIQYEIREYHGRFHVFRRKQKKWLFIETGITIFSSWKDVADFDTEKEAVEFIKHKIK